MKRNGWKTLAFAATTIVAIGGAVTVLEAYAPWAPKITLAIAGENKLVGSIATLFCSKLCWTRPSPWGTREKFKA